MPGTALSIVMATLTFAAAEADEPEDERATHIVDTSTDRAPARTTFPKYPRIARRDRIEGKATVCFTIDTRGRIHNARIREASHRIFRRPALRAMRASTFEALGPGEVLERSRTCRTYRFRLEPILASAGSADN